VNESLYNKREGLADEDTDFTVLCDEKRIKQVLINLQSNALKFTKDGGKITIITRLIPQFGKAGWGGGIDSTELLETQS
jgi:K+-sensing histidine kinase KdpD